MGRLALLAALAVTFGVARALLVDADPLPVADEISGATSSSASGDAPAVLAAHAQAVAGADDSAPTADAEPTAEPPVAPETPPSSEDGPPTPTAPVVDARFVAGWIEVTVAPGVGIGPGWKGRAYALPAGHAGVRDANDAPGVDVVLTTPARFPVVRAGAYDVGVVWAGGAVMRRDVWVGAGGTGLVALELPAVAPIEFVRRGDGPTPPRGQRNTFSVTVESTAGATAALPGRDEGVALGVHFAPDDGERSFRTPMGLPIDARVRVVAIVEREESGSCWTSTADEEAWEYAVEPAEVCGGGRVTLTARARGTLVLRPQADPSLWPVFPAVVILSGRRDGGAGATSRAFDVRRTFATARDARAWCRAGEAIDCLPGRWTVHVDGNGVAAAPVSADVASDETTTVGLDVRADDGAIDDEIDLGTVSCGPEAIEADEGRVAVALGAIADEALAPAVSTRDVGCGSSYRPDTLLLDGTWFLRRWYRRDLGIVLFADGRASRPAPIPAEGAWSPPVEAGGFAVFAASAVPPPELGPLTIRRADGFHVASRAHDAPSQRRRGRRGRGPEPQLRDVLPLTAGTVLGPFPPGPMRLVARVGGVDLPEIVVPITAGAETPFSIDPP